MATAKPDGASLSREDQDERFEEAILGDNEEEDEEGLDKRLDKQSQEKVTLAGKETKYVNVLRIILVLALVVVATFVCVGTYLAACAEEQHVFETEFYNMAEKIVTSFAEDAAVKGRAVDSLAVAMVSHVLHSNEKWPFATLPDFERRARLALDLSRFISIMYLPLIRNDTLDQWNEYSVNNQDWFVEGLFLQPNLDVESLLETDLSISTGVFNRGPPGPDGESTETPVQPDDEGPFFPIWQFSPVVPSAYVVNMNTQTLEGMEALSGTRRAIGPAFDFDADDGAQDFTNDLLRQYGSGEKSYDGGPLSYYFVPIFDGFQKSQKVVGFLISWMYWQTYFENLLPYDSNGIVCVLENSCGQSFTFVINGLEATFLGNEDLHDISYDYLEVSTDEKVFLHEAPGEDSNSTLPLQPGNDEMEDGMGCRYRVRVFPSQEMANHYLTNMPLYFALGLLSAFLFTALVFVAYDRLVERRQQVVMKTAIQSTSVVSKLFPENVRDRLYGAECGDTTSEDSRHGGSTPKSLMSSFVGGDRSLPSPEHMQRDDNPIADEYMDCTVFFADLAGFTKWSSTRSPSQVFILLETLYGSFDKVAHRLGVFKIETIGDCYLAVTGLPTPQKRHAVIMAQFASNCLFKMNQIVNSEELINKLGSDTAELQLRVGMHSGPVTAGVLRGEKARFQLFGDTVNTASRMESNGQKGKIQASVATATLLEAAGKQSWLEPRKDPIVAKGKGEMKTFWINIPFRDTSTAGFRSSVSSTDPTVGYDALAEC